MMAGYTRNCHVQVFAQIILHKSCFSYIRQRFCNAHTRMESLQFTSLLDLSYLESMYLVSWMLKVPSTFHSPTLLHQLFFFKWYLLKNVNHLFESQFCFPASELSQYGVLLCVCVFTYIHREGFICLEQLGVPGNRSTMLRWRRWIPLLVPFISTLEYAEPNLSASHFILFIH